MKFIDGMRAARLRAVAALSASPIPAEPRGEVVATHPDDEAVDRFAAAMKAKLSKKRSEGRGGWENKDECSADFLSDLLRGHVEKGDPVDVANLAMMLHQRDERIAAPEQPGPEPVAWREKWRGDAEWHYSTSPRLIRDDDAEDYIQEPLYTHPAPSYREGITVTAEMVEAALAHWCAKLPKSTREQPVPDKLREHMRGTLDAALRKIGAGQ